jgi:hypothetical protein
MLLVPSVALGQFSDGYAQRSAASNVVSADGVAMIQRPATAMRLYVELTGKGGTAQEAIAQLRECERAARAKLRQLAAVENSIIVSSPTRRTDDDTKRRQVEAMIRERMGGQSSKTLKLPQSVTIAATLVADWPLKSADDPLLEATLIQEKIKAADVAGLLDAGKQNAEEEELAEELEGMDDPFGGGEEVPAGEPHFVYVASISAEERDTGMAEAYKNAQGKARRLAKAAGVELGPLAALSGSDGSSSSMPGFDEQVYAMIGDNYARQQYMQQMIGRLPDSRAEQRERETLGNDPTQLVFVFQVQAAFQLQH